MSPSIKFGVLRRRLFTGSVSPTTSGTKAMATSNSTPQREPVSGERLLRVEDVMVKAGIGRTTIYAWISQKRFPAPVVLSPKAVRWRQSEVEIWIASLSGTVVQQVAAVAVSHPEGCPPTRAQSPT